MTQPSATNSVKAL